MQKYAVYVVPSTPNTPQKVIKIQLDSGKSWILDTFSNTWLELQGGTE